MSKKKTYNKGVESGLRVAQNVIEQEAEAMDYLKSKIDLIVDGHDEMKAAVNLLIEDADENAIINIFGICNGDKPNNLKEHEKKLLLNVLAALSVSGLNDNQRRFFNNLRHHLNVQGYEPIPNYDFSKIEALETVRSIKMIAKAVRIFLYLQDCSMDGIYRHEDDLFSHFELRSFDEIDVMIELLVYLFGADGLVEIYGDFNEPEQKNFRHLDVLEDALGISEFEEISISGHIRSDEAVTYKCKIIHVQGNVSCEGNLAFDKCVLHYGEKGCGSSIELGNAATLKMKNCTIQGHGFDDNVFIDATKTDAVIQFVSCDFVNCCSFLKTKGQFCLEECRATNLGGDFVKNAGTAKGEVLKCTFETREEPEYIVKSRENKSVFNCKGIAFSDCIVSGNQVLLEENIAQAKKEELKCECFLNVCEYNIKNSTFLGMSYLVAKGNGDIELSSFKYCDYLFFDGKVKVEDCRFDNCAAIGLGLKKESRIAHCQINECFGTLISSCDGGGITVEFCEFNNWKQPALDQFQSLSLTDSLRLSPYYKYMLNFCRKENESQENLVKACVFYNANVGNSFLIHGSTDRKSVGFVATVEGCDFINCTTERLNKKLIKTMDSYTPKMSKKSKEFMVIWVASDCKGLDQVNTSHGDVRNVAPKEKTSTGIPIGATAKEIAAGVPGFVAVMD